MIELLPCPLCASTNVSDGICFVGDRSTSEPAVRCVDCGCRATLAAWSSRIEGGKCYGSTTVSKTVSAGSTPAPSAIPAHAQKAMGPTEAQIDAAARALFQRDVEEDVCDGSYDDPDNLALHPRIRADAEAALRAALTEGDPGTVSEDQLARVLWEAEFDGEAYPWDAQDTASQLTFRAQARAALKAFRVCALPSTDRGSAA